MLRHSAEQRLWLRGVQPLSALNAFGRPTACARSRNVSFCAPDSYLDRGTLALRLIRLSTPTPTIFSLYFVLDGGGGSG